MKILLLIFILTLSYSLKAQNDPELFPVNDRKVGFLGYYLADGTNVVKGQFCTAGYNIDGYYMVSKAEHEYYEDGRRKENHIPNTEKFGLLNSKGEFIINFSDNYNFVGVEKGLIYVIRNNFYGVVNDKNEILVPIEYEELDIKKQGVIIAKKNTKYGIITKENKILVPFIYDNIFSFAENELANTFYVIVSKDNKNGIIDKNHKFIFRLPKTDLVFVTVKSIGIKKGNKYNLVDHNLKAILPNDFEKMYLIDVEGTGIYATSNGYGYYFDIDGKLLKKEKLIEEGMKTGY
ncbi:WG repeat-containing protein [Kaistella carnis]|uniref:WG repeat-containing protein n=1 Tax=Kaistella carnis TaxID=1241979 RepID=A0A3G8XHK9_9FLAO|nr:WG repeat-containing protein [Kaistella carnis]AZI32860.1 WG repeat-containing protein [Kaistella carnis]